MKNRKKGAINKGIERALDKIKKYDVDAYKHFIHALGQYTAFEKCYNSREDIDWYLG